jgi:hypothetical protein
MQRICTAGLLAIGILFLWSGPARALSLADAVAGGSFFSGNGLLEFSDFSASTVGSIPSDLSLYDITILDDGFILSGVFSAAGGEVGDMLLSYDVTSASPITQAHLGFNGQAIGQGAQAAVTETFTGLNESLFVYAIGDDGQQLEDSVLLGGEFGLEVFKDIQVDSSLIDGGAGGIATISLIRQTFDVPEPSVGLLSLLGVACLLTGRRLFETRSSR